MKRFLKPAVSAAFALAISAVTANAEPTMPAAGLQSAAAAEAPSPTTGNKCCWVYVNGMWLCLPCG
jgi:hypothetical protein